MLTTGRTDGRTDGHHQSISRNCFAIRPKIKNIAVATYSCTTVSFQTLGFLVAIIVQRIILLYKLEELDFASDIALISKTDRVNNIAGSTGLQINTSKTQVMMINPTSNAPVTLNGKDLEEVGSFIYLGATVSKSGRAADDMKRRLGLARIAFNKLSKIWKDSHIGRKTKLKIFRSNVVSFL